MNKRYWASPRSHPPCPLPEPARPADDCAARDNGTPPGDGTQLFWWPCETRWSSGSQLWNIIPVNVDGNGQTRGYYFINQWTGKCLTLDPATVSAKVGKVTQAACPAR